MRAERLPVLPTRSCGAALKMGSLGDYEGTRNETGPDLVGAILPAVGLDLVATLLSFSPFLLGVYLSVAREMGMRPGYPFGLGAFCALSPLESGRSGPGSLTPGPDPPVYVEKSRISPKNLSP